MRLLVFCEPSAYAGGRTDVPRTLLASAEAFGPVAIVRPSELVDTGELHVRWLEAGDSEAALFAIAERSAQVLPWEHFDLAFDRTLKPFPAGFQRALSQGRGRVPFVNDPAGIERQHASASYLLERAAAYLPEARVATRAGHLGDYLERFGAAVLKRANSCGGQGVFKVEASPSGVRVDDLKREAQHFPNVDAAFTYALGEEDALVLMRYLRRVTEGDKRVLVVDGEIYGAYLRRNPDGWLQNVSAGARTTLAAVSDDEREAIADTAHRYAEDGLRTLGYDFIQDDDGRWRISEINAGNIGGFTRLAELGGEDSLPRFLAWLRAGGPGPARLTPAPGCPILAPCPRPPKRSRRRCG